MHLVELCFGGGRQLWKYLNILEYLNLKNQLGMSGGRVYLKFDFMFK